MNYRYSSNPRFKPFIEKRKGDRDLKTGCSLLAAGSRLTVGMANLQGPQIEQRRIGNLSIGV
jgi:hypothetical protein